MVETTVEGIVEVVMAETVQSMVETVISEAACMSITECIHNTIYRKMWLLSTPRYQVHIIL